MVDTLGPRDLFAGILRPKSWVLGRDAEFAQRSSAFSAMGVPDMQLEFFPRGRAGSFRMAKTDDVQLSMKPLFVQLHRVLASKLSLMRGTCSKLYLGIGSFHTGKCVCRWEGSLRD